MHINKYPETFRGVLDLHNRVNASTAISTYPFQPRAGSPGSPSCGFVANHVHSVFRFHQRTKAPKALEAILALVRRQCRVIGFPAKLLPTTRALEYISGSSLPGQRFCDSSNRDLRSRVDRLPWSGMALHRRCRQRSGRGQFNLVPGVESRFADLDTLNLIHSIRSGFPGFMFDGTKQQISVHATA